MTIDELAERVDRQAAWVRRAAWVVFAASLLAFVVRGADNPADPHLASTARRPLPGFSEVRLRVTQPAGGFLEWCALLAATLAAQEQGLMGQRDLRGYDAMVFRFPEPTTTPFYMFRTSLPLSIAWFAPNGEFVGATDMDPCTSTVADRCRLFRSPAPYRAAIEVPQGSLGRLGLLPGSVVSAPAGRCL